MPLQRLQQSHLIMDKENVYPLVASACKNKPLTARSHYRCQRDGKLLIAMQEDINKGCNVDMTQTGPHLKQPNHQLQLQTKAHKTTDPLESQIHAGYNHMPYTQILTKLLQIQSKQNHNSDQIQENLQQRGSRMQIRAQQSQARKDQQIGASLCCVFQYEAISRYEVELKRKELMLKDGIIAELERRYSKIRSERDRFAQSVGQLKEEADISKSENCRLLTILRQKQAQVENLHQTIAKNKDGHSQQMQNKDKRLESIENILSTQLVSQNANYHQLQTILEDYITNLNQCQTLLAQSLKEKLQLQSYYERKFAQKEEQVNSNQQSNKIPSLRLQTQQNQHITSQSKSTDLICQLNDQISNLQISIKQITLNHQIQLCQSKDARRLCQSQKNATICQLQNSVLKSRQERIQFQKKITQLQNQESLGRKNLETSSHQISKLKNLLQEGANRQRKYLKKQSDIQSLIGKLKKQLQKFSQIIYQKEAKIQSYRNEVMGLRKQVKLKFIQNQSILSSFQPVRNQIQKLLELKVQLQTQIKNQERLCLQQQKQIGIQSKKSKGEQKKCIPAQCEEKKSEVAINRLLKELEKIKSKYENAIQELTLSKQQFRQELQQKQVLIQHLHQDSSRIKTAFGHIQNQEIQTLLDQKINQLRVFYQQKIKQQSERYKHIIQALKGQITELYQDIDLKKSMQAQIFDRIIRINMARNSQIPQ